MPFGPWIIISLFFFLILNSFWPTHNRFAGKFQGFVSLFDLSELQGRFGDRVGALARESVGLSAVHAVSANSIERRPCQSACRQQTRPAGLGRREPGASGEEAASEDLPRRRAERRDGKGVLCAAGSFVAPRVRRCRPQLSQHPEATLAVVCSVTQGPLLPHPVPLGVDVSVTGTAGGTGPWQGGQGL